jgi:hypothetical protein
MGVLTDLLIADKSETPAVVKTSAPWSVWRGFDAKGHSEITLGILHCLLRGEDHHETPLADFPLLAGRRSVAVFEVPEDLIVSVGRLSDDQIPAVVSE